MASCLIKKKCFVLFFSGGFVNILNVFSLAQTFQSPPFEVNDWHTTVEHIHALLWCIKLWEQLQKTPTVMFVFAQRVLPNNPLAGVMWLMSVFRNAKEVLGIKTGRLKPVTCKPSQALMNALTTKVQGSGLFKFEGCRPWLMSFLDFLHF